MKSLLFSLGLFVLSFMSPSLADEAGCCAGCGKQCCLKPVCRLECEMKTVTEVVYDCRCEDFCALGHSKKCGEVCEPDSCGHMKKRTLWQPSCDKVHCRHVLIRQEIKKEVPHYKCVVEYVCDGCCCQCDRVPASQMAALNITAGQLNAAATAKTPLVEGQAQPAPSIAKRNLFWPVLFGK